MLELANNSEYDIECEKHGINNHGMLVNFGEDVDGAYCHLCLFELYEKLGLKKCKRINQQLNKGK